MVPLPLEQMVATAPVILTGTCRSVRSFWQDGRLMTEVELDRLLEIQGLAAARVTILLPGGVDRNRPHPIQTVAVGAPSFEPGTEVMVFLRPLESFPGAYTVVGLSQGKFDLPAGASNRVSAQSADLDALARVRSLLATANP